MNEFALQLLKCLLSVLASLPIAVIVFGTVFLCCGMSPRYFEIFYGDIISSLTLASLLTQRTFKEAEKRLEKLHYVVKYIIVSSLVVGCGVLLFAAESFFVLRYFPGQTDIIILHRYWFTITVMMSLFFFDHQVIHHPYPYKIIFWYLISWLLYYVINDSIPLSLARTTIYIGFYRHHILRFMPTEFLTTPNRLVIFSVLLCLHTIIFQELAMLSDASAELAQYRAIYYQSFLNFGFTLANHRLVKRQQQKVLVNKKYLPVYILICYGYGIIIGFLVMLVYHGVFFPYFFQKVISQELPKTDSLYVASTLNWIDRVSYVQTLSYVRPKEDVEQPHDDHHGLIVSTPHSVTENLSQLEHVL
ncbi:Transmembrane domain-containing protein [Spironucleus salmonicida]|uniref:Transmembrane domain-containing protein n=1 Tax=Spironucleus salmonicida TaxID=348837 RepID=V6LUH6_9EUKA|nr:Transmembrane domain-containing protein [Spironucleus salmonicida]KAH0575228.1 Transmembrane domain-containing protein [Spironucleus salmonicida]|eukprot:EST47913.1 Transmembrane domain-containing protein [Spironucleus salmonicida]